MEKNNHTFLIQNSIFGLLVGLTFIVTSFVYFKTGQNICVNPQLNNIIMLLSITGIFIGVRKYRDDHLDGYISYGKTLGACTLLITTAALLYGIYVYFLYSSDANLLTDYVTILEAAFKEAYAGSPMLDTLTTMLKTFTTPASIAFAEVFNKIFTGFILSLFMAGALKKNNLNPKL